MNYFENDLKSLHEGLVNKDFSAEELAKETFETIKKREEKIDAFITLDEERAMEKARAVDAKGIDEGNVLDGIPEDDGSQQNARKLQSDLQCDGHGQA